MYSILFLGGLFAANRKMFFELGAYDNQMEIW